MAEPDIPSEECRAQAVAWFLSSEKTIAEIAHTLNLPESVVREWVWNATPEDVADEARPEPAAAVRAEPQPTLAETAATNAAAVEAVLRAEIMAAEAVARAEAVAADAKRAASDALAQLEVVRAELNAARAEIAVLAAAEAAARDEIRAVYAEAVEAVIRAEAASGDEPPDADESSVADEPPVTDAVVRPETKSPFAEALARVQTVRVEAVESPEAPSAAPAAPPAPVAAAQSRDLDRAAAEAEARAKIAEVMAKAKPVELWVNATGRTLEAATEEALARLGVDEDEAEVEVLANGSRWLPGRVQVRARVRGRTDLRLIAKPAGPGPVASAGPGPTDGRG